MMQKNYNLHCHTSSAKYEAICIVAPSLAAVPEEFSEAQTALENFKSIDGAFGSGVSVAACNGTMVLFSSTGPLNRDQDDVRSFYDAANSCVRRALQAKKTNILVVPSRDSDSLKSMTAEEQAQFDRFMEVAAMGALEGIYVPLENRERREYKHSVVDVSVYGLDAAKRDRLDAIQQAMTVGRDLGGSDPERMAPPRMAEYVEKSFSEFEDIKVNIVTDQNQITKDYPCFAAVNRATLNVPRHHGRVIFMEYRNGTPTEHLVLCGKGVTYDTGGADIKAGGVMAGMHRDKCGASNVIGFMYGIGKIKPKNIHITAAACCVRNSIGSECYVADEIIRTRAGKYIRVGNTDAEGRMAMVDVLCHLKERAVAEKWVNPKLFTWATLTGHSCLAFGEHYTAIMDNGMARRSNMAQRLSGAGHKVADPFEISTIRREDYNFVQGKDIYTDILQANNAPSTRTPRGHQYPAAFMIRASGLDGHGIDADVPLSYSHVDMAPSAGPFPGLPTGNPIRAFMEAFIQSGGEDAMN